MNENLNQTDPPKNRLIFASLGLVVIKLVVLAGILAGEFSILPYITLNAVYNPLWAISVLVDGVVFTWVNVYLIIFFYRNGSLGQLKQFLAEHDPSPPPPENYSGFFGQVSAKAKKRLAIFQLSMLTLALTGYAIWPLYPWLEPYFLNLKIHILIGAPMFAAYSYFLFFAIKQMGASRRTAWFFALYPLFAVTDVRTPTPLLLVFLYNVFIIPMFLIISLIREVPSHKRKDAFVWSILFFGLVTTIETGAFTILDPTNLRFQFVQRIYHGYFAMFLLFVLPPALIYFINKKIRGREISYLALSKAFVFLGLLSVAATAGVNYGKSRVRGYFYEGETYPSALASKIDKVELKTFDHELLLGSNECLKCHPVAHKQWAVSTHAFASRNTAFQAIVKSLVDQHGIEFARACANCHEPALAYSDRIDLLIDPEYIMNKSEGVSCRSCHLMTKAAEKNGVYEITIPRSDIEYRDREKRGSFMVKAVLEHQADYTKDITLSGEQCYPCHSLRSHRGSEVYVPVDNVTSYLESSFAREKGILCHDCHMPRIEEDKFHYSWKDHRLFGSQTYLDSVGLGLDLFTRKEVERFTAENLNFLFNRLEVMEIFPAVMDETFKSYMFRDYIHQFKKVFLIDDVARDGEGFTAEITDYTIVPKKSGRELDLTIHLHNRFLGHDFPSSLFANIVRVWTELTITDAKGVELIRTEFDPNVLSNQLGRIEITDAGEHIDPDESLDYTKIVNMKFIRPDIGYDDHYQIPLPAKTAWPLSVDFALKFQRYNDSQVNWMSKGEFTSFAPLTLVELNTTLNRRMAGY